jgi:predicted DCC family thiol-disulfide oxidoreductase YuxK
MIPIAMARDAIDGRYVILYDPDCGFCRCCTALLLVWDRDHRLRPRALGAPEADALLHDLPREQRFSSWHLIAPDGERRSAGAALPAVLRLLPGGRLPAAALAAAPNQTERAYRFIAEHRTAFGRRLPAGVKARASALVERREAAAAPPDRRLRQNRSR